MGVEANNSNAFQQPNTATNLPKHASNIRYVAIESTNERCAVIICGADANTTEEFPNTSTHNATVRASSNSASASSVHSNALSSSMPSSSVRNAASSAAYSRASSSPSTCGCSCACQCACRCSSARPSSSSLLFGSVE